MDFPKGRFDFLRRAFDAATLLREQKKCQRHIVVKETYDNRGAAGRPKRKTGFTAEPFWRDMRPSRTIIHDIFPDRTVVHMVEPKFKETLPRNQATTFKARNAWPRPHRIRFQGP